MNSWLGEEYGELRQISRLQSSGVKPFVFDLRLIRCACAIMFSEDDWICCGFLKQHNLPGVQSVRHSSAQFGKDWKASIYGETGWFWLESGFFRGFCVEDFLSKQMEFPEHSILAWHFWVLICLALPCLPSDYLFHVVHGDRYVSVLRIDFVVWRGALITIWWGHVPIPLLSWKFLRTKIAEWISWSGETMGYGFTQLDFKEVMKDSLQT